MYSPMLSVKGYTRRNGTVVASYLRLCITNQFIIDRINIKAGVVKKVVDVDDYSYSHELTDGVHSCWDISKPTIVKAALAIPTRKYHIGDVYNTSDDGLGLMQQLNDDENESGYHDCDAKDTFISYDVIEDDEDNIIDLRLSNTWQLDLGLDYSAEKEFSKSHITYNYDKGEAYIKRDVRTYLNDKEQEWLDDNKHLIPKELDVHLPALSNGDSSDANTVQLNEDQVDTHTTLASTEFSKDATEQNKEGYKIFGTNKGHDSAIWVAVRFSKQSAINMVKRVKEHLSADELDYLRYIILDDNISLPSCIRTVLPQHNTYKTLTCWLKTIRTGTHYTATGAKVGFRPYPAMFVKARKEMELLAPKQVLHIDYYQPTTSCPEGFANIWTTKGDDITGTHQICFFTTTSYQTQIDSIIRRAKAAGYNIIAKNDMYNNCIASTGRTPMYKTVRTLWNNPISYIEASVEVLVR